MIENDMTFTDPAQLVDYQALRQTLYEHNHTLFYDPFTDTWQIFNESEFIGEVEDMYDICKEDCLTHVFNNLN